MKGYTARDVAAMLSLSVTQVRADAQYLSAPRGPRGEYQFSFQDLVLLKTAKELVAARVPAGRVRRGLKNLREQLPGGRPLTGVRIVADGKDLLVQDGGTVWNPGSGQVLFDFAVSDLAARAEPVARRAAEAAKREERQLTAEDWYDLGCSLESTLPAEARDAYARALTIDPDHADAHVNLGRLSHEEGDLRAAEAHYRMALAALPEHATAAFNLGVVLEDQRRPEEAVDAYEQAIASDPGASDAHYNLSQIFERLGKKAAAFRHLKAYRQLVLDR